MLQPRILMGCNGRSICVESPSHYKVKGAKVTFVAAKGWRGLSVADNLHF